LLNTFQQQVEVLHAICLCKRIEAECNHLPRTLNGDLHSRVYSLQRCTFCPTKYHSFYTHDTTAKLFALEARRGILAFIAVSWLVVREAVWRLLGARGILFSLGIPALKYTPWHGIANLLQCTLYSARCKSYRYIYPIPIYRYKSLYRYRPALVIRCLRSESRQQGRDHIHPVVCKCTERRMDAITPCTTYGKRRVASCDLKAHKRTVTMLCLI
jgi:hypothetical protein